MFKVVKQAADIGGFASANGALASVTAEMDHIKAVVMHNQIVVLVGSEGLVTLTLNDKRPF